MMEGGGAPDQTQQRRRLSVTFGLRWEMNLLKRPGSATVSRNLITVWLLPPRRKRNKRRMISSWCTVEGRFISFYCDLKRDSSAKWFHSCQKKTVCTNNSRRITVEPQTTFENRETVQKHQKEHYHLMLRRRRKAFSVPQRGRFLVKQQKKQTAKHWSEEGTEKQTQVWAKETHCSPERLQNQWTSC